MHYKSMGILITDNFVIQKAFFAFNVLRFNALVWAYKKVTKKSVNFVPTGKDYDAVMIFYGGTQNFRAKEKIVGEVLVFAAERAPWAVIGFSKDIETLYSKHQAEFCQAVEGRRRDLISKKV